MNPQPRLVVGTLTVLGNSAFLLQQVGQRKPSSFPPFRAVTTCSSMAAFKLHVPCAPVFALLLLVLSGCTSTVIGPDKNRAPDVAFTNRFHGGNDYEPRSSPATITHDPEETLVRAGYYELGEMWVGVSKHDREQIREIFLREAAARGGDLICLTVEARKIREAAQKEVHPIEATTVSKPYYYTPNGPAVDSQHTEIGFKAGESYVEDVYQLRYQIAGTVWRRYDPLEVGRLPAEERKAIDAWMQHPDGPWALAPAHFRDIRGGQDKSQIIAWFGGAGIHIQVKAGASVEMWMWQYPYPPRAGTVPRFGCLAVCFDSKGKVTTSSFRVDDSTTINEN